MDAYYQLPGTSVPRTDSYSAHYSYDRNGNILSLQRNGEQDLASSVIEIEDLDYTYNDGNLLEKVNDLENNPAGFDMNGKGTNVQYGYDDYGNLVSDPYKEITDISYNHLNLPVKITFGGGGKIEYFYDATGVKLKKKVTNGTTITTTEYMDTSPTLSTGSFQYTNGKLDFFPHAEGYAKAIPSGLGGGTSYTFKYVFSYTDDLGNIRVKYAQNPANGNQIEILEEDHYYPYGLKHIGYNGNHTTWDVTPGGQITLTPVNPFLGDTYKYKFGGKEYQDEFDINTYDFGARNYDPALGRWMNLDPLAEMMRRHSPYNYAFNNPIYYIDPDGMEAMASPIISTDGELLGTDSEGWTGEAIVMDEGDFSQGMEHSDALDKGTELGSYEEGISISDDTWDTIESEGGEVMSPFLENNSDSTVFYKPEGGDNNDAAIAVESGEDVYVGVDGVATSKYSDSVLKIPTGWTIEITSEGGGNIDFYGFGGLGRMAPGIGWIKKEYIKNKNPKDTSWDNVFKKANEIGKEKY